MPLLRWNLYDLIACLEVEPSADENQVSHEFRVHREGVLLNVTVREYESVVELSLRSETNPEPLIEFVVFVRDRIISQANGSDEWLVLRDCVLAGSRFSYIDISDVFDRNRFPHCHELRIQVRPQIQIEMTSE